MTHRSEFTIRLQTVRTTAYERSASLPDLLAIVSVDDMSDAEDEAEQLVKALNGMVDVVSIVPGSLCGK
jgi:hypothetical protein